MNDVVSSVVGIIRSSLCVKDGVVSFRCRVGRGSGKAVEIPVDQFGEFVALINEFYAKKDSKCCAEGGDTCCANCTNGV